MKVVLVYPGMGVLGFDQREMRSGESHWIQHGLASIGAYLKTQGHEVNLVDMRICVSWDDAISKISEHDPEVIGVSCSCLDYKYVRDLLRLLRSRMEGVVTVVGGILPSIDTEEAKTMMADYIITGEGEITFGKLVHSNNGIMRHEFPVVIPGERPLLDALPFVDREIFEYSRELCFGMANQTPPIITMIAGRGCPYRCEYCQPAESAVFGGKFRMRSPENVVEELRQLRDRYHFNSITWWDDTFTINPKWIDRFCDLYEGNGFKASMLACCRADIICNNEPMIERLASVGMKCFIIGFESGVQRLLDFIQKGTTVEQNFKAAKICRKYGIEIMGTFMLGLPTETQDESLETARMLREIQPEYPMVFYFTPIPGTKLYDYCEKNHLILREDKFDIERTSQYDPKIRGVDYGFIEAIRNGEVS